VGGAGGGKERKGRRRKGEGEVRRSERRGGVGRVGGGRKWEGGMIWTDILPSSDK
jgi:hypothetical protein